MAADATGSDVIGVVLAGGRSSRMGVDKAFVEVDGVPMVRRVGDALVAGGCSSVVCQGGDGDRLTAAGLTVLADDGEHQGPVAAVATARRRLPGLLVVAACDLPDLTGDTVAALRERSVRSGRPVVARAAGRRHLLVALPACSSEAVEAAADEPVGSFRELLDRIGAVEFEVDERVVHNVNRPDDLGSRPLADGGDSLRAR